MRLVGAVTTSRADYGIYRPLLRRIVADPELSLHLIVSGTHLCEAFGTTLREIEADGFRAAERVEIPFLSDDAVGIAHSMGTAFLGYARAFARVRPDILAVLGDRFEMHAAALAALPFRIPVAHVHGGEVSEGAMDEALRHAMTKLSHLHFVSTPEYARRVIQLGEEPWRVQVSGAPALDNLRAVPLCDAQTLEAEYGVRVTAETVLVTFHPATLVFEDAGRQMDELLAALHETGRPVLFTMPNADSGGRAVRGRIMAYVSTHADAAFTESLGTRGYFSAMAACAAMAGNSSSGLIEAPSFGLPCVNIGERQRGRVRARNVIDVECNRAAIGRALELALKPEFRASLAGLPNPYGNGAAAETIVNCLKRTKLDQRLVLKRFHDIDGASAK